jgi:FK506-binding protein 4/5
MAKGEVAIFTIKSDYAYGDRGSPPKIPGGATLIFEVELFDFEGEDVSKDSDKSLIKRIKTSGEGYDHPNDGGSVTICIKGQCKSLGVIDEREITFLMGEGLESLVPKGIELALEKMKKNEESHLTIAPKLTIGGQGVPQDNKESITYNLHLKSFERAKESWQLDGEQKLEQAAIFKEAGTTFFKQGKFDLAANKYNKIIEFLEHEISLKGDKETERKALLQAGRLNLSMCKIKVGDWIEARNLCDKVIDENPALAKAYFRRGEALVALNEHELAMRDFVKVLELDPENKAAKNKVAICMHQVKLIKEKEKKTFANMFDKVLKH